MANSNGIITAPISIADVKAVIGSSSNDLGTLCRYGNGNGDGSTSGINMWAKYKPIALWKTGASGVLVLNDTLKGGTGSDKNKVTAAGMHRKGNRFGLKIPYSADLPNSLTNTVWLGALLAYSSGSHPTNSLNDLYLDYDWQYVVPAGGAAQPYRLSDFNGYDHHASPVNADLHPNLNGGFPSDVLVERINAMVNESQNIIFGLAYPNSTTSFTWNELISAIGGNGAWYVCGEIYDASSPSTNSEAGKLGIYNSSRAFCQPVLQVRAPQPISGNADLTQYTLTLPSTNASLPSKFTIVIGLKMFNTPPSATVFSGSTVANAAILPPFWPIRRFSKEVGFPWNMYCTHVCYYTSSGVTQVALSTALSSGGITTTSSNIIFRFKCTASSSGSVTLNSAAMTCSSGGSWSAEPDNTDKGTCKFCDSSGGVLAQQTRTITSGQTIDDLYILCKGVVGVGVTTQFFVSQSVAGQQPTVTGIQGLNVKRTS